MKSFMNENFLLSNQTAELLYHNYAKNMPIIDYHCHLNPREIAKNRRFENITRVWLEGDHYKWRLMRANGIDEEYITGDAEDREKFFMWAKTLEKCIGNPLYHWSHLELQRYFGYNGILSEKTAPEVWELCNERLDNPDMCARELIKKSNVHLICTTDDPIDSLKWHEEISQDDSFDVMVLPTWRPDRAFAIDSPAFCDYLLSLGEVTHLKISSFQTLCLALKRRMGFFHVAAQNFCHNFSLFLTQIFGKYFRNLIHETEGFLPSVFLTFKMIITLLFNVGYNDLFFDFYLFLRKGCNLFLKLIDSVTYLLTLFA